MKQSLILAGFVNGEVNVPDKSGWLWSAEEIGGTCQSGNDPSGHACWVLEVEKKGGDAFEYPPNLIVTPSGTPGNTPITGSYYGVTPASSSNSYTFYVYFVDSQGDFVYPRFSILMHEAYS